MRYIKYYGYIITLIPFNNKTFFNIKSESGNYAYNGGIVKSERHAETAAKRFINKLLKKTVKTITNEIQ